MMRKLTSRFKKLDDGPDGDVLEGCIRAREEPIQVFVHATFRFVPDVVEGGVVVRCSATVCEDHTCSAMSVAQRIQLLPFDERLPRAAALLPCTSELGELVNGMSTSQIPISSNCPFSSSGTADISQTHRGMKGLNVPLSARTAIQAVISLCTFIGTSRTSSLML